VELIIARRIQTSIITFPNTMVCKSRKEYVKTNVIPIKPKSTGNSNKKLTKDFLLKLLPKKYFNE
jgi:hypothetical protein